MPITPPFREVLLGASHGHQHVSPLLRFSASPVPLSRLTFHASRFAETIPKSQSSLSGNGIGCDAKKARAKLRLVPPKRPEQERVSLATFASGPQEVVDGLP